MPTRNLVVVLLGLLALTGSPAIAEETIRIGLIASLTGPFTPVGREVTTGARLYMQQNGDTVAGRKIELLIRDDAGVADNARRLAQELIVNDGVKIITGLNVTPIALAVGSLVSQAKIPA